MGMVGNPMTLMMIAAGVMMFAVPYITVRSVLFHNMSRSTYLYLLSQKNMDPEMQAEFQANQAKLSGIQNSFMNGDVAGRFVLYYTASQGA